MYGQTKDRNRQPHVYQLHDKAGRADTDLHTQIYNLKAMNMLLILIIR